MSIAGVARLFVGKPIHPVGDDGRMALSDHLRELRARVLKAGFVIVAGFVVALFFFDPIFEIVNDPYQQARATLGEDRTVATTSGVAGGFLLYLKLCGLASLVRPFPLLVLLVGRLRGRSVEKRPIRPSMSLIIAAYNEEKTIGTVIRRVKTALMDRVPLIGGCRRRACVMRSASSN